MTEVRFYHLQRQRIEQALPALLSKAYENGHRILVKCPDETIVEQLNTYLWTYHEHSFLPHGSKKDDFADRQPIFLTAGDENENDADTLILTSGTAHEDMSNFKLCCEMFDGNNPEALNTARPTLEKL